MQDNDLTPTDAVEDLEVTDEESVVGGATAQVRKDSGEARVRKDSGELTGTSDKTKQPTPLGSVVVDFRV